MGVGWLPTRRLHIGTHELSRQNLPPRYWHFIGYVVFFTVCYFIYLVGKSLLANLTPKKKDPETKDEDDEGWLSRLVNT